MNRLSALPSTVFALIALLDAASAGCSSAPMHQIPDGGSNADTQNPDDQPNNPDTSTPETTPAPDGGPPIAQATSYVVTGHLTLTATSNGQQPPTIPQQPTFTLRLDPAAKTILVGGSGSATRVAVRTDTNPTFQATADVPVPLGSSISVCGASATFKSFWFTVGPDGLVGSAEGTADIVMGDYGVNYGATLAMSGQLDKTGPTLGNDVTGADPLGGVVLIPSEPLPANTTAQLTSGGDTITLTPSAPADGGGVVVGFSTPSGVALRYGTTYALGVTPWMDLAGNAGATLPQIVTQAAPPLAAQDGFESATGFVGGATVVDSSALPAITGQRSVVVAGGFGLPPSLGASQRMTVRLAVAAGNTKVKFSVRPFGVAAGLMGPFNNAFRVAVPGGAVVFAPPFQASENTMLTVPNGTSTTTLWIAGAQTIEIPLPAGAGAEIVFDAASPRFSSTCGLAPEPVNYQIDDLRVE